MEYYSDSWLDLAWSPWTELAISDDQVDNAPRDPGLYRVRHTELPGLTYIGQSGNVWRRIRQLAGRTNDDEMPYRDPHTAAPCHWAILDAYGPGLEISFTAPPAAADKPERCAIEAALIANYRREEGESPTANFGRIIPGYKQSSSRSKGVQGGILPADASESAAEPGVAPRSWDARTPVTGPNWMGLNWSAPHRLGDRTSMALPTNGLYRIWYDSAPPLAYIGQSSNLLGRLYSHEQTFGPDATVAVADAPSLDTRHKREEIETDLIGAHYLVTGEPPLAQFGNTDAVPTSCG